jgi:hypothetical protein
MKTITLGAITALTCTTLAGAAPITFDADGVTWTVVEGGNGVSATYPDSPRACGVVQVDVLGL